jgi:putative ABC transport system permease protein
VNTTKQIVAVTAMNLRSLPQRVAPSLVIVIGIAGVVGVLLAVLSLSQGLASTLATTGRADRAIVLHADANSEIASAMTRDAVLKVLDAPGVAHGADGKPIASAEMLAVLRLLRRDTGALGMLTIRGVGPNLFALRSEVKLVEGRLPASGLNELIAGRAAQARFGRLDVGERIKVGNADWTIVGAFTSGRGDAHEAEVFADAETLLSAYQRTTFNSVTVKMTSPEALPPLQKALSGDATLAVSVALESVYYQQHSQIFSRVLALIANLVGSIMAIGAVFAALNSMYAVVSARTLEIATLRALGFGASAVVVSVIFESLVLALIGALAGASLAWLFFDGRTVSTIAGGGIGNVIFHLRIGIGLVIVGIVWACIVGLIGGLLPAIRAARLPVATALRAV